MKKLIAILIIILVFSLPTWAQQPTPQSPAVEQPKPNTTTLTVDESKQLKAAFELAGQAESEAKAAADRSAARNGEAKALYWQLIVLKKIDIDKWQFSGFDEKGIATFAEKSTQQGKTEEKK